MSRKAIRILIVLLLAGFQMSLRGQDRLSAYSILSSRVKADGGSELPDKCGLPAIAAALHDRQQVSQSEQNALETILTRPVRQKYVETNFFRIHYDTTGPNTPAMLRQFPVPERIPGSYDEFADSVVAAVRRTFRFEIDTLGYPAPPSDGGAGGDNRYDIYISELGDLYGQTTPENLIGGTAAPRYTSFIEIDNDFIFVRTPPGHQVNRGYRAMWVTVAHEFFHAIQLGNYGFWDSDRYYYEISSVWMEDVVFTDVDDYYLYLHDPQGHFRNPEVPFATSNLLIEYSRGIWGQFLEKRFGRDAMKRTWEQIQLVPPLQAIDDALSFPPYSTSFRLAFSEWSLWNYFTGYRSDTTNYPQGRDYLYPEARNFPPMRQNAVEFTAPSRVIEGANTPLSPLASRYYQVMVPADTVTDTLALVLSNINFDAALHDPGATFPFRYLLNVNRVDASYRQTGVGIFYKLDVSDQLSNWWTWDVSSTGIGKPSIAQGIAFPNPFRPEHSGRVRIAISRQEPAPGTLRIFSSSMDLVYSFEGQAKRFLPDVWCFDWDGMKDNNVPAGSGVYYYVLELLKEGVITESLRGKLALIRK